MSRLAAEPLPGPDGIETRIDAERMRGRLARALAELPTEEVEVLLLLVWAELDQPEIADALEIPVGTVKSRLSRARGRLEAALGAEPATKPTANPATHGGIRWTT